MGVKVSVRPSTGVHTACVSVLSGHEAALGWRPVVGVGLVRPAIPLCAFHKTEKDHSGRDAG
jgi:hypothetical protein